MYWDCTILVCARIMEENNARVSQDCRILVYYQNSTIPVHPRIVQYWYTGAYQDCKILVYTRSLYQDCTILVCTRIEVVIYRMTEWRTYLFTCTLIQSFPLKTLINHKGVGQQKTTRCCYWDLNKIGKCERFIIIIIVVFFSCCCCCCCCSS